MYIGRTGDGSHYEDGIYILLKEVLDNAVDEFIMGHGRKIEIAVENGRVRVRDYGRGIPLGKVVECVSPINTGAKYNDDVFQFSVGLNGVGTKAVNALSAEFFVRSHRDGKFAEARFESGRLAARKEGKNAAEPDGTLIEFAPDPKIFPAYAFQEEHLLRRLRFYAYLNAGLLLHYNGQTVVAQDGLLDLIRQESHFEKIYPPLHCRAQNLEMAFTHTNRFDEQFYSFVNGQFTTDGGTHLSAFKEGLLKGINEYSRQHFTSDDIREGIVAAIAIRVKDPVFESQTKHKPATPKSAPRSWRRSATWRRPAAPQRRPWKNLAKLAETRKLREELLNVKKWRGSARKPCPSAFRSSATASCITTRKSKPDSTRPSSSPKASRRRLDREPPRRHPPGDFHRANP